MIDFDRIGAHWKDPRRVIAIGEWHLGGIYPRVGSIVTNMGRAAGNLIAFYNERGSIHA
ncbi:MAG: hypothetical protein ACREDM_13805 [Methylocella sp.]